jgi:hypothetical protein
MASAARRRSRNRAGGDRAPPAPLPGRVSPPRAVALELPRPPHLQTRASGASTSSSVAPLAVTSAGRAATGFRARPAGAPRARAQPVRDEGIGRDPLRLSIGRAERHEGTKQVQALPGGRPSSAPEARGRRVSGPRGNKRGAHQALATPPGLKAPTLTNARSPVTRTRPEGGRPPLRVLEAAKSARTPGVDNACGKRDGGRGDRRCSHARAVVRSLSSSRPRSDGECLLGLTSLPFTHVFRPVGRELTSLAA